MYEKLKNVRNALYVYIIQFNESFDESLSSNRDAFNEYKNVLVEIKSTSMLKKKRKSQNDVQNLLSEHVKDENKEGEVDKEGNCNDKKESCGDMDIVIEINNNLDQKLINNNNVIKTNNNKNENLKNKTKTKVPKAKSSKKKNQEQDNKDNKDTSLNELKISLTVSFVTVTTSSQLLIARVKIFST